MSWEEPIPADRTVICEGVRDGPERKTVYQSDRKLIHSRADEVTLTAVVTSQGENFDAMIDPNPLMNHLPEDKKRTSVDTVIQDQLEDLGYK